ncbi:zinc metalloendopeptidase [Protomyces lactucae-debilis]|uniref:Zinc metalloendopeptidase n=1 Tax=Protomyces lactucae-debilis TaxID=2754530 RepID=A0A1Y2F5U9_PROLT|nr:zinc metalloendopeptidase [Protomyces lactucae-debilis]ORY79037.1 zinc metalloendopeptidase [Protomyces lactucae-debilis]
MSTVSFHRRLLAAFSVSLLFAIIFSVRYLSIDSILPAQLSGSSIWKTKGTSIDVAPVTTAPSLFSTPPQAPINFSLSAEQIHSAAEKLIREAQAAHDEIASSKVADFSKVVKPLAEVQSDFLRNGHLTFLYTVSADESVRNASTQAEQDIMDWMADAEMREDHFHLVQQVVDAGLQDLDEEDARLATFMVRDGHARGLSLNVTLRNRLIQIEKESVTVQLAFERALANNDDALWFTDLELDGVPRDLVESWQSNADGKHKMTFAYPHYFPVMSYCRNATTRKAAARTYQSRCPNNTDLLIEMLALRREASDILGFSNTADHLLQDSMAKDSPRVLDFLNTLKTAIASSRDKDLEQLGKVKTDAGGQLPLYVWDTSFYDNTLLEQQYHVDAEKVAEYFELTNTMRGMLNMYEKLFSLHFVLLDETSNLWHADVQQYAVWRLDTGDFVGYIYFDLHPRENKFKHAASFSISPGFLERNGSRHYPSNAIVCNFSEPKDGKPSLLKHSEVETLFHELGHGIHALVGKTKYARFHAHTASDFMETPSTMLEYWVWHPEVLKHLSSHYLTDEPMPDSLMKDLIRTKHVLSSISNARQIGLATFDMRIHTAAEPFTKDQLTTLYNECLTDADGILRRDQSAGDVYTPGQGSFGHIMAGYAAGYYSYHWSRVFAADLYYGAGFNERPLDPELGARYRDEILAPGGSRDEEVMMERFLGRKPNNAAFLAELTDVQ